MTVKRILISSLLVDRQAPKPEERYDYLERIRKSFVSSGIEVAYFSLDKDSRAQYRDSIQFGDLLSLKWIFNILKADRAELWGATVCLAKSRNWPNFKAFIRLLKFFVAFDQAFRDYSPDVVALYSQFKPHHRLAESVLRKLGVRCLYLHTGQLPGSFSIEEQGQMAESELTSRYANASHAHSPANQSARIAKYVQYVTVNRVNRKKQSYNTATTELVANIRKRGKKVVFYAGCNDYESGMHPPGTRRAKTHSPFFDSSEDGLIALAELAGKLDFEIIFKPHPNLHYNQPTSSDTVCVHVITDGEIYSLIEECDVTATILSQVAYPGAMLGKPVILMGRNGIEASGGVYTIKSRQTLEVDLKKALMEGFTEKMKRDFEAFIGFLLDEHLYAYSEELEGYFARKPENTARHLNYTH